MWQRFTEKARKAIFYAQEEAQRFGEGYVSTEHLLLGVLREVDNTACRALERCAVSAGIVVAEVEKQLPRSDAIPSQDMTLTPRAKRVIDLAYDEARNLNNNYIGSEHILLGLSREGDGLAGRVLVACGVELEELRRSVLSLQMENDAVPRDVGTAPRPMSATASTTELLAIRQRRSLYDRLAIMLLADDRSAADLVRDAGLNPGNIQTAIEDLLCPSPDVRATLGVEAHTLEDLIGEAAKLTRNAPLTGAHFFVAVALDDKASLGRVLESMGCSVESLLERLDSRT